MGSTSDGSALPGGNLGGAAEKLSTNAMTALMLRLGLGAVFTIGGWSKLSQLIDPARSDAIVALYTGPKGYINTFFLEYLFGPAAWFSPWAFLTALSSFELLSGIALLVGLFVRPLALFYGFLLWTFVFSLPVVLTPGVAVTEKTYLAPALLVQIRDITLSGLMFILFNLGSGARSLDQRLMGPGVLKPLVNWEHLGLLLRLSLAATLLVGGFFAGMANIKDFGMPAFLMILAGLAMIVDARAARVAGGAMVVMMIVYMLGKLSLDKSLIGNLNAIKREFALAAAGFVLMVRGGGDLYTAPHLWTRISETFDEARAHLKAQPLSLSGLRVPGKMGVVGFAIVASALFAITAPSANAQGFFGGGKLPKQMVSIKTSERPGTIIVSFADRRLYKLTGRGEAVSYPIGIPKAIARWDGVLRVTQKRKNPAWRPTQSMLKRNPRLPSYVPGGHPQNPMGKRALYLGHTFYRIHGTDAPWTIGEAASSGCVRMYNDHAIDLYNRTRIGAKVIVTWKRYTTRGGVAGL
ncbi:MAG: L,D-transpeptidase family protein [Pseudomonadota bacterium]